MSLSLLAPAALVLTALCLLPVIAHMARQKPSIETPFGAMMLLNRVVKRLRRRRRIRDWLLFLLRFLALLLLMFATIRPTFIYPDAPSEYGGSGRVIFVMDQSMSMSLAVGGQSLMDEARQDALTVLSELPPDTLVGIVGYGSGAVRLIPSLTAEHGRVRTRLESIQTKYERSNLRAALLESRKLLAGEPGEVFVFTDEAGPHMFVEARHEVKMLLEQGNAIVPRPLHAKTIANVAVLDAKYGDGLEGGTVSLTVSNFGTEPVEVPCEVTLPDGQNIPIFVEVPGQGNATKTITVPREAKGGVGRVHCEDSALAMDNSRYFHLPRVGASRVLVVDGKPGDTPSASEIYYLERALAPWGGRQSGLTPDVVTPMGLTALDPSVHQVVFIANVSDPRPMAGILTEFVRGGGGLVVSMGDNITAERYNGALGGILPALLRKPRALTAPGEDGVPLMLPNSKHASFRTFLRDGRLGFQRIRSQRVMTLESYVETQDVSTLLTYEGGMPALVERKVGSGRVLVWTSSLDWDWSNFPLQAVFMPYMQRLVSYLGGEAGATARATTGEVGEVVQIPLPSLNLDPEVLGPDGPIRSTLEGSKLLFTPSVPGAYEVTVPDAPPIAWVAVNVDNTESDIRRTEGLSALQLEVKPDLILRKFPLGMYFLWAVFGLIVAQALVSIRGRS